MKRFILHKAGDSTRETVLRNAHAFLDSLNPSRPWIVEFREYHKPRSNDANAYLWSGCYGTIVRELGYTMEDWHEEMCIRYFGPVTMQKPRGSETRPVRTTTTNERGEPDTLTGKDFWDYVEFVRWQAAEGGVVIPEPNQDFRDMRED